MMSMLNLIAVSSAADVSDVWVYAPNRRSLDIVGVGFAEGTDGDWVRVHATSEGLSKIQDAGQPWIAVPPPSADALLGYHSPEDMMEALRDLEALAPDLVTLVEVGLSIEYRPIMAAVITAANEPNARWRVMGAHHGDELPTGELALAFAQALVDGYGTDDAITTLLQRDAVWVLPHTNPDGLIRVSRANAAGIDLNRNYSHQWSPKAYGAGPAPFSEPETRAIAAMSLWNSFHAGLSLHSGATNIGWVWNHTTKHAPDATLMSSMATRYADHTGNPDFWITNGAEWYITHGDTTDWTYGRLGTLDFTLEVSEDKTPPASGLPDLIAEHVPAMLDFVTTPELLSGQVVDASTGRGIPAMIMLDGQPMLTGPTGHFAQVHSKTGLMTAMASGYTPQTTTQTTLSLIPTTLTLARPDPALLPRDSDGWFAFDGETVTLTRPGEVDVMAQPMEGGWWVDQSTLTPGPWSIVVDGQTAPRALFIGEVDQRVILHAVEATPTTLTLSGSALGVGTQVFAMWGSDRAPVPLTVLTASADAITIDRAGLPEAEETIDLLVLSSGYQLPVLDVLGTPQLDAPPDLLNGPTDTATPPHNDAPAVSQPAGCSSLPITPSWPLLVLTFGLIARRQT